MTGGAPRLFTVRVDGWSCQCWGKGEGSRASHSAAAGIYKSSFPFVTVRWFGNDIEFFEMKIHVY